MMKTSSSTFSAQAQMSSSSSRSFVTSNSTSSSSSSKQVSASGVRVLPALNQPVQLQEPNSPATSRKLQEQQQHQNHQLMLQQLSKKTAQDHVDNKAATATSATSHHQASIDSNEADRFIEQLMKEAETDPKLRELTYGNKQQTQQPQQKEQHAPPMLNESYPMVQRPYRTAQDLIIKDRDDESTSRSPSASRMGRPLERHKMPARPYRTNEDMKIIESRSKSADCRVDNGNAPASAEAFRKVDPRLDNFTKRGSSTNLTEDLLNEVVTDKEHHSVKDLVRLMEKNTKTESLNPYVRKWGCDLISPEPHSKNVTYRKERRELVNRERMNATLAKTYMWKDDDLFKRRNNIDYNDNNMMVMSNEQEHSPSGRGENGAPTGYYPEAVEARTADLDDLLGRSSHQQLQQRGQDEADKMVIWPPPSPAPNENYPSPVCSPPPPPPNAMPLPPPSPSPVPVIEVADTQQLQPRKSNLKKPANNPRSRSEGSRRFSNASLNEIDQQIVRIQNEFEAELDTLIDAYRNIQNTKKSTTTSASTNVVSSKSTKSINVSSSSSSSHNNKMESRSRRGKHVNQNGLLSDDEGTYQALSVVFEDTSTGSSSRIECGETSRRNLIPSEWLLISRFLAIPVFAVSSFSSARSKNDHVLLPDPNAPPRPPLPADGLTHSGGPPRPPPPPANLDTTDDESEDLFQHAPTPSQGPIMVNYLCRMFSTMNR